MFKELVLILMGGILVNNYVLQQFLGICPFLGVSKKVNQATGMGIAVTFVMLVATAATWPIYYFILSPKYEYLQIIVFILVIASLVQFVEVILKKFLPALHKSLGVYLPLITTNCAVLGVTILNIALVVTQVSKACLTHHALGHHTACKADLDLSLLLCGKVGKTLLDVCRIGILGILGDLEGVCSCLAQRRELLAANAQDITQIYFRLNGGILDLFSHFILLFSRGSRR